MKLIDDVQIMEIGDEFIAVPTGDAGEALHGVIRLNGTGKAIWDALADGLDERAVAARLAAEYAVDEAVALGDVREIVAKLRAAGILID